MPVDAAAYRAAAAALSRGETAAAVAQLEALAQRYPRNFAVAESLGLGYAHQRRWPQSLRWLKLAAALRPDLPVARNNYGITCMRAGQRQLGLQQFRLAARSFPHDFDSQLNAGQALAQWGDVHNAIAPLRRAWQLKKNDARTAYDLALALFDDHQAAEASHVLSQIPGAGSMAAVQSLWGDVDETLGHYQAAGQHLQQAARLDPGEPNTYRLGMEFLRHWTLDAAIAVFRQGASDYPGSRRIATALALARYGKGEYTPALDEMARLLSAGPGNRGLLRFFGTACTTASIDAPACSALIPFARQNPGDGEAAAYAAGVLLHRAEATGPTPASLAAPSDFVQQALREAPHDAITQYEAGVLASMQRRWPDAVMHLERARSLNPEDEAVHFKLAQAYQHNGEKQQALAEMTRHQILIHHQQSDFDRRYRAIQRFIVQIEPKDAAANH